MGILSNLFQPNGTSSTGQPVQTAAPAAPAPPAGTPAPSAAPAATPAPSPGSALDPFKALWETPTNEKGEPIVHSDPLATPLLKFDPKAISETASKMDFVANIPQEELQKVVGQGGDVTALANLINTAVRAAVVGVTTSQGNLMNQVIQANNDRLKTVLPTEIKRAQLGQQQEEDPILSHPAVTPLIEALKQAEFNKNPSANPAEIHKRVTDYVKSLGTAITGQQQAVQAAAGPKEQNWLEWAKS